MLWNLHNPYTLPIRFTLHLDGQVTAELAALGQGRTSDEALLNLAKNIQSILENWRAA